MAEGRFDASGNFVALIVAGTANVNLARNLQRRLHLQRYLRCTVIQ